MAKMMFGTRLAAFGVALAMPVAAVAQYGQPNPPPPQTMPGHGQNENARGQATPTAAAEPAAAGQVFAGAACLVGRNATAGDALLATIPYSAAERAQAARLLPEMRRCTHGPQLVTNAATVRGAFAEATLETVFATPPTPRMPPLEAVPLPRPTEGDANYLAQIAPMYQLADCATPRQPGLVRAVLATDAGSPAEGSAVEALYPTFQACVPAGTALRIDHRIMRWLFAEALYRWSVVQRDGPASPLAASQPPAQSATPGASH